MSRYLSFFDFLEFQFILNFYYKCLQFSHEENFHWSECYHVQQHRPATTDLESPDISSHVTRYVQEEILQVPRPSEKFEGRIPGGTIGSWGLWIRSWRRHREATNETENREDKVSPKWRPGSRSTHAAHIKVNGISRTAASNTGFQEYGQNWWIQTGKNPLAVIIDGYQLDMSEGNNREVYLFLINIHDWSTLLLLHHLYHLLPPWYIIEGSIMTSKIPSIK